MAVEILLPEIDSSMRKGEVAKWMAKDGDHVTEGQPLFSLSDAQPGDVVAAPATGTLKITASTGVTYEVGTMLGYIE